MPTYKIEYRVIDVDQGKELSRNNVFEVYADNANDAVLEFNLKMPIKNRQPALMVNCSRISNDRKPVLDAVDIRPN